MSASNKKKLRKEQNAASLTEKQQKELKEVKKLKAYTVTFVVVMVLVVAIIAGVTLRAPVAGIIDRATTAITVGNHSLSTTELSFYYAEAINSYVNQFSSYGDYATLYMQMMGLNPSLPLDQQIYEQSTGKTWADYFVASAKDNAKWTYTMYDAAIAAKYTLPAEEQAVVDSLESTLSYYASYAGYSSVSAYLRSIYGDGATLKNYTEYYRMNMIASSFATDYHDSLKFTDADFRAHETDKKHEYNSYSYAVYELDSEDYLSFLGLGTTSTGEDGKETTTYSDEDKAQALAAALADAKLLTAEGIADVGTLNAAINALLINQPTADDSEETEETEETESTEEAQDAETEESEETEEAEETEPTEEPDTTAPVEATLGKHVLYSKLASELNEEAQKWLSDAARQAGNVTYLEISTGEGDDKVVTGYYVVMYTGVNENTYYSADVRHILVKFTGGTKVDGETVYSQEEKDAAKAKAQAILDEYLANENPTSDIFATLAKSKSEDTGSSEDGGLISGVNWDAGYVEAFTQWSVDQHQVGDTDLVETEYGWHIMFYEAQSELTYRDQMINSVLVSDAYTAWEDAMLAGVTVTDHNLKGLETDFIISG